MVSLSGCPTPTTTVSMHLRPAKVIIHTIEVKRTQEALQKKISDKPFILGTDNFKCKLTFLVDSCREVSGLLCR